MAEDRPDLARARLERYAERMRFLAEAGKTLAGSLDYQTTLRNVADLAVPAVADWCVIYLLDDDAELRRIAAAHTNPDAARLLERLGRRYPDAPAPPDRVQQVVRSGEPQLLPRITDELMSDAARDDDHRQLLEMLDTASCIIAPLVARNVTLGALALVCGSSSDVYDTEDLEMAVELASRAALAIDNARLVATLEQTQQHLEHSAADLESQAEELQAAVEELESTTEELLEANEELTRARGMAERAQKAAEEANEAKSQFLATMSHELRTPLNAIDGYAELLELGIHGPVTQQQREALRRLRRAQKRLLSLINDVLNFAKLESGQIVIDYGQVSVGEVLADVEAVVAPQIAEKGLTLIVEMATPELELFADARKVEQIVLNLLSNAVKFTGSGGQIRITASAEGDMAVIRVADTGSGIPADRLPSVFEPFVQVQAGMIRDHGGAGLGLSISRDLAQRMDGDLRAESREGVGSTFTLVLPLAPGAAARPPDRAQLREDDAADRAAGELSGWDRAGDKA